MCFHNIIGKFIIIVSEEDSQDGNLLLKLRIRIDNAILEILEKEGNKGYDNIKDEDIGVADIELGAGSQA